MNVHCVPLVFIVCLVVVYFSYFYVYYLSVTVDSDDDDSDSEMEVDPQQVCGHSVWYKFSAVIKFYFTCNLDVQTSNNKLVTLWLKCIN